MSSADIHDGEENSSLDEAESVQESGKEPVNSTSIPDHPEAWEFFETLFEKDEDSEETPAGQTLPDDPFLVAFALFCDLYKITRAAYSVFVSIATLASPDSLSKLPKSLSTLKKWTYSQLPLAKLHNTDIEVATIKLPAGRPARDEPEVKMHYFNKSEILTRMLSNPTIFNRMYFGFQLLSDNPLDLWESRLWGESILSTSGRCAYFPNTTEPLLPGDSIIYKETASISECQTELLRFGKIQQVCLDNRKTSPSNGELVVVVQPILAFSQLPSTLQLVLQAFKLRYFLVEDETISIPVARICQRATIFYHDDMVEDSKEANYNTIHPETLPAYVQVTHIVNVLGAVNSRPISLRHELLAEAELRVYGRSKLLELLQPKRSRKVISIPTVTFIDGFTAFHKVQLSILGVYTVPANLPLRDRLSPKNLFPLTLGPMGSNTTHAAEILRKTEKQLAGGFNTIINGQEVSIISFDIAKTGDMPQQNENCALNSHRAARSCRMCHVLDIQRSDSQYDIHQNGRYLDREDATRVKALSFKTQTARQDHLKDWGLKPHRSIWIENQPALLPNRMTPQEPCHILAQGLAQIYQEILVDCILKESAKSSYGETIRATPITPEWTRLQSPTAHHRSYSYNQYGQITQINPYALRQCLKDTHITRACTTGIQTEFAAEMKKFSWSVADVVVKMYCHLPRLMHLIFTRTSSFHSVNTVRKEVVNFIENYKRFIKATVKVADQKGYLQRSNLHALLHIPETIENYATVVNVVCSPGEAKHRPFKHEASRTNHRNVDLRLIQHEMEWEAIRFTLDGAFASTNPTITDMLLKIKGVAPMLFAAVSPLSRSLERIGLDDDEFISHAGNALAIRVTNRIKQQHLGPWHPPKAEPGTFVRDQLELFYSKAQATRLPAGLSPFKVRYYRKITFFSPATRVVPERIMRFKADDILYVMLEGVKIPVLLDAVFLPTVQDKTDVFFLAYPLEVVTKDSLLSQSVYIQTATPVVVHIGDIIHEYAHFMPYEKAQITADQSSNQGLIWENEWFTAHY
jgi:hypothetical protein